MKPQSFDSVVAAVSSSRLVPARLDQRLVEWSREVGQSYRLPAGTLALQQGSAAGHVLLLDAGVAFLRRIERNGVEVSVALCQPGSMLGLASVLRGTPHAVSVHMKTDAMVIAIAASQILDAVSRPDLGPSLVGQLVTDHLGLIERYGTRALPVRDRILSLLRDIGRQTGRVPWGVQLSTAEIASLTAANVSHICRVLRMLRAEGIVDFARGRMVVRVPLD
jgi:CRP-like cAMP-binding protein